MVGKFYTKWVPLPPNEVPPEIANNDKFFPYFEDCLGAIDGSHFHAKVSADDMPRFRNQKGWISQNVLVACRFSLVFCYILSGWEGSAADSRIYDDARRRDFLIPPNKYYLADAGFGLCDGLLTPYRQVRYHLKEWSRGNQRYAFNYIFYLFFLYITHADLKMHKNFSICGMQWQEMR